MKIENEIKLDFNDVLIRPKRSTMSSRSEVNLERTFAFPNSKQTWTGVPIIAANMDTIGTYDVYKILSQHKIITAFHKFYTPDDFNLMSLCTEGLDPDFFMISTGINDADFERLGNIIETLKNADNRVDVKFICIDVANGYMNKLCDFCLKVRDAFPNKIIVAGNVVSREITEDLILRGIHEPESTILFRQDG